jgi:hypothetical protein
MAALERIAPDLRAILAAHVALQFVDGRRLRPTHDVQRHFLMRVAAEAADLEVEVSGVLCIAQSGGRAVPAPCSRACAGSMRRTPGGRLPCAILRRAQPTRGSTRHRSSRVTL